MTSLRTYTNFNELYMWEKFANFNELYNRDYRMEKLWIEVSNALTNYLFYYTITVN